MKIVFQTPAERIELKQELRFIRAYILDRLQANNVDAKESQRLFPYFFTIADDLAPRPVGPAPSTPKPRAVNL